MHIVKRIKTALKGWKPCTNTAMLIEQYNAQQTFDMEMEGGVCS